MAGTLFLKEVSTYALSTSDCASLANNIATTAIGLNLDNRSSATAPNSALAIFQLQCSFNATTALSVNTDIADLYLLPAMDGSTFPTIGTSQIAPPFQVGSFINSASTVAVSTVVTYVTDPKGVDLFPVLYKAAIVNVSGQTINSSWSLKVSLAQGNYS